MSGRVMRDFRRQAAKAARQGVEAVAPVIGAALKNEQMTRQRVDLLESRADAMRGSIDACEAVLYRGFFGRLKWLSLGR